MAQPGRRGRIADRDYGRAVSPRAPGTSDHGAGHIGRHGGVDVGVGALRQPSTASFIDPAQQPDDPFLDELELMLSGPHVPGLSPLDEITPRIREVVVNIW